MPELDDAAAQAAQGKAQMPECIDPHQYQPHQQGDGPDAAPVEVAGERGVHRQQALALLRGGVETRPAHRLCSMPISAWRMRSVTKSMIMTVTMIRIRMAETSE